MNILFLFSFFLLLLFYELCFGIDAIPADDKQRCQSHLTSQHHDTLSNAKYIRVECLSCHRDYNDIKYCKGMTDLEREGARQQEREIAREQESEIASER